MTLVQLETKHIAKDIAIRELHQPWYHLVPGDPALLLLLENSKIYALPSELSAPSAHELKELVHPAEGAPPAVRFEREPSALSLNIAQSCNLSCSYCYADEGRFEGAARMMPLETALQAIRRHITDSTEKSLSIGFIGGEPFLNRHVLHASVEFAKVQAAQKGVALTFGITTNGTLLEAEDLTLLRNNRFAVTISMDGMQATHDALRHTRRGQPSFERIVSKVSPLLSDPGMAIIAARATLTRLNLDISAHISALSAVGFREIGVSPLRTGPDPALRLRECDWALLLHQMKVAATREWEMTKRTTDPLRLSNLAIAMRQLHRGAAESLPCGSAATYVSLSADGRYYTCHRTIGDAALDLGDLKSGPSTSARQLFVERRLVDTQEPCHSCWARYLCGGGCHAEVLQAGRAGCDYIRGWLEYCISLYPEVLAHRPDLVDA